MKSKQINYAMTITITHKNPEVFNEYLTSVLNIACVVAGHGNIPTDIEQTIPQHGRYWWRDHNRFHLYSTANDWWANVRAESESSITLQFSKRHDNNGVSDALATLIALRMPDAVTLNQ